MTEGCSELLDSDLAVYYLPCCPVALSAKKGRGPREEVNQGLRRTGKSTEHISLEN